MTRRVHDVEADAFDLDLVAIADPHRDHVRLGLLAHHGDAMSAVAQFAETGDVIGVKVGVDGLHQLEVEFAQQLAIAVDLLQHGIENQRFAAGAARQQIAVGSGDAVEQLAKDHDDLLVVIPGARSVNPESRNLDYTGFRVHAQARVPE